MNAPLKIAVIAGESSGDLLGADLIRQMRQLSQKPLELIGVGGPGLMAEGLVSLFDFSELSIMGVTAVLKQLPRLLRRIGQTADAIIAAKPDVLIIIDSPDFTHRVARKVRKVLPDLAVINYVCPSVWAWKPKRAPAMRAYVDHVLAVLPFEPEALKTLDGPPSTYVGHRLRSLPTLLEARNQLIERRLSEPLGPRTILLLPGSRSSEIAKLMPEFEKVAVILSERGTYRFMMPTVKHREAQIREIVAGWSIKPEIFVGEEAKWSAFAQADAAVAASGTVTLELALTGIPTVSCYKTDVFIRFFLSRITVWSASLPNLIADRQVVQECFDEFIRPGLVARLLERLAIDTPERAAMIAGFDTIFERMATGEPSGLTAARAVFATMAKKNPASS
ncbi:lipid-A-disaccharide synthase [Rhizobium alvei]|uniref:Lipid-A-disaccharide synthase n=1 Tax=Rhizobium alvei TaxID=1132659 RepID=A0ABT8YKB0_9HYPH|nr:lipid-A-disaccharide synthase [Rhizobium alvei]MDO6964083.1 lipid-A-disaccharide synthase [Rhizobium alvei]